MPIEIIGTGAYAPEYTVTNDDFTAFLDTSDEWIRTRTGMWRRHISLGEPAWYMGAQAAERALEAAKIEAGDVDFLLCTTVTPDCDFPSNACLIQEKIGAVGAFAFDIAVACAGITYALDMARRYLQTGDVDTVLIVCTERLTRTVDYSDRRTCVLFGDGAGACVVRRRAGGPFGSYLHSDSSGAKLLYSWRPEPAPAPFPEKARAFEEQLFEVDPEHPMYMAGREVYKFATKAMPVAVERACEKAGVSVGELKLIIPHQANLRIIETAVKNLGFPMDRVFVNIEEYGNASSATIAIALDECARSGRLRRGDLFCMVGFGSGLVTGAVVMAY